MSRATESESGAYGVKGISLALVPRGSLEEFGQPSDGSGLGLTY